MVASNNEAKVRVRLDTGPAKAAMAGLQQQAIGAARGIGSSLMRALGLGAAFSAGAGAAQAAFQGPTATAAGDIAGEFFGPWGAQLRQSLFDGLDAKAIAARRAREETIGVFGLTAGMQGKIPDAAANFNSHVRQIREQEEAGRQLFERDERFFALTEERKAAVDGLIDAMNNLQKTVQNMSAGFGSLFAGK